MAKKKTITEEELCLWIEYYKTHTLNETITRFNTSYAVIRRIFEENNVTIRSSAEEYALGIKHRNITCLEKYGDSNYRNIEKREKTCLEKYGTEHYTQSNDYKDRLPQLIDKARKTKLEYYGNENYNNSEKCQETKLNKYGNPTYNNREKYKQTCLERYGFESYSKTEDFKQMLTERKDEIVSKIKKHFNTLYGVDSYLSTEEFLVKSDITKKKNKTFNSSLPENNLYENLCKIFKDDVKRQYKDFERYPFNCDFYIKSLDLFIELNLSWTHGGHPFDVNSEEDIKILNKWKSKNSKYYDNAIYTWTDLDIRKLNKFKSNNLNYVILYTKDDINNLLKILSEFNLQNQKDV